MSPVIVVDTNVIAYLYLLGDYTPQAEAESLLAGAEYEVETQLVPDLVRDSDCSAHACEFVAPAKTPGVALVTMDAKVLRAFPKHALALISL